LRIVTVVALGLATAACRGDQERGASSLGSSKAARESNRQMTMARPLAGCYLLVGDSVGPYRVQLYPWRTAHAWVARPLGADTMTAGARTEWSWTPTGPDGFDLRREGARRVTGFTLRRSDSSWTAFMAAAPAHESRTVQSQLHVERIECPPPQAFADGGRG
jgi:hypothetical protein